MGQSITTQLPEPIGDTVESISYEIQKHAQSLKQINSLTYEEFQQCLSSLNEL